MHSIIDLDSGQLDCFALIDDDQQQVFLKTLAITKLSIARSKVSPTSEILISTSQTCYFEEFMSIPTPYATMRRIASAKTLAFNSALEILAWRMTG